MNHLPRCSLDAEDTLEDIFDLASLLTLASPFPAENFTLKLQETLSFFQSLHRWRNTKLVELVLSVFFIPLGSQTSLLVSICLKLLVLMT